MVTYDAARRTRDATRSDGDVVARGNFRNDVEKFRFIFSNVVKPDEERVGVPRLVMNRGGEDMRKRTSTLATGRRGTV